MFHVISLDPLSHTPWISVSGTGYSTPAPTVCKFLPEWLTALEGFAHLECHQDAVKVVNRHSKIDSQSQSRSAGWFSGSRES